MQEQTANAATANAALSPLELTGRVRTHVQASPELGCVLHREAAAALLALRAAAANDGIELVLVSAFRDFDHQLAIWNGKFRGERLLLDAHSHPVAVADLTAAERVAAILVWSALPGASRHHWGTDCDVIDRRALHPGARPELLSTHFEPGGCYGELAAWLAEHAQHYGFFRPYDCDRGGVQPEPWHLSFAPVAEPALRAMSVELLVEALAGRQLEGGEVLSTQLPQLFERYVRAVASAPPAALAAGALSPATRLA